MGDGNTLEKKEESEISPEKAKWLIRTVVTGLEFLFIGFTVGIVSKYVFNLQWVEILVDICIIVSFVAVTFIKRKMDIKKYEEQKHAKEQQSQVQVEQNEG